MLDAGFVAAVLEGFEGTLDEVVARVASPELSTRSGCTANPDQRAQSFDRTAGSREIGLPGALVVALPTEQIGGKRR